MTKQEFDEAVERLRQGHELSSEPERRVWVAASFIIRKRRGLDPEQPWPGPSVDELAEFLVSADRRQRKLLKEIAEELIVEVETQH